jgi:hypothetical protein
MFNEQLVVLLYIRRILLMKMAKILLSSTAFATGLCPPELADMDKQGSISERGSSATGLMA